MTKKKILKSLIYFGTFALSVSIMLGAGFYRKTIPDESAKFQVNLSGEESQTIKQVEFDIQNEGWPKKLVQPGRISISTGHGGGIANKGKEPVWIQVKAEGFKGNSRIDSTDPSFDKGTESFNSPILPGKSLSVGVNLDIPRKYINKDYQISTGTIVLTDSKSGKLLAKIPVKVVNSKFSQLANSN